MSKRLRAIIWAAVSTKPQADEDEKFSLPKQLEDGRAAAARHGWDVIDELIVPGHSRSYRSLDVLAADARAVGIDAFDRLIDHLHAGDFDVIICRDANRFARKASLLHYIVESIVEDCNAMIYSLHDNLLVTGQNVDMWVTMKGYATRSEIRWFVEATDAGTKRRVERGLPARKLPFSHRYIRDERLRPIGVEIIEDYRRLYDDVYDLIVNQRTPLQHIEVALTARGHMGADGRPFADNAIYTWLHLPIVWGHVTYGHTRRADGRPGNGRTYGAWLFDPALPLPEGVFARLNVLPAVYTGEQAAALKDELLRRKQMRGKRSPHRTSMYSGLFVCGKCGSTMAIRRATGRSTTSLHCPRASASKRKTTNYANDCDELHISAEYIKRYIDQLLRLLLSQADPVLPGISSDETANRLNLLQADIAALDQQIDALIMLQAAAVPAAQSAYQRRIDAAAEQADLLRAQLTTAERRQAAQQYQREQFAAALKTLSGIMAGFWTLPEPAINQHLHRLLGSRRFVVRDGRIAGIVDQPRRPRIRRKQ